MDKRVVNNRPHDSLCSYLSFYNQEPVTPILDKDLFQETVDNDH